MKKLNQLFIKLLDKLFDYTNVKTAEKARITALAIIIELPCNSIGKDWLRRQIAIRRRIMLTEHQLELLIKLLQYDLPSYHITLRNTPMLIQLLRPAEKPRPFTAGRMSRGMEK